MPKITVTFHPSGRRSEIEPGATIMEAARSAGLRLRSSCGADAACGKCRVVVKKGRVETVRSGILTPEEIGQGLVLACNSRVLEDLSVEIPAESHEGEGAVLLSGKSQNRPDTFDSNSSGGPLASKIFLQLPAPTLQDPAGDWERLCRALRRSGFDNLRTELANLKDLAGFLRRHNWAVTATIGRLTQGPELLQLEGGDTSESNYGLAVDIGTTTIALQLVDLTGRVTVCSRGAFNNQISYGDDIISRIIFASEKNGLETLRQAVAGNINDLIGGCLSDAEARSKGIRPEDITGLFCAGNPTMLHLLLGVDPGHLRREPYAPAANRFPVIRASESGIRINPQGLLACAPGVSGYIGADITAGLLASGMAARPELAMYIDLGTNGEIVLGNKDWLAGCACSIGPAFEGSGIGCGARAVPGAIHKIQIDPSSKKAIIESIGQEKPAGLCGSGLIELLSELLKNGIIDKAGKIQPSGAQNIRSGPNGLEYLVLPKQLSGSGKDIILSQPEIDHLIRSKAALYAGISTLLKKMGHSVRDISRFYIAGGFGSHLDIAKSIDIGLLPNAPPEKFSYIGNGSIEGARLILLSQDALAEAGRIAAKMAYIELSADNSFNEEFISAMFLPHTDLSLFSAG